MEGPVSSALAVAAALLSLKSAVTHILAARARIINKKSFGSNGNLFVPILKYSVGAFQNWPTPSIEDMERIEKNQAENEPHILLAIALCANANVISPALTIQLTQVFVASRFLHTTMMLLGSNSGFVKTSIQTASWVPSFLIPTLLGSMVLAGR